ncbi:MAG: DNA replication/repair protein RecF [Halothiobacillaceae bacterium]|nr:DNA replication/repair protein RecF [Halothiobacillaceae bacterium]
MRLNRLTLENIRNLAPSELNLGPALNRFSGPNGAGKSSLLEAIHLLASGRSFRTAQSERLIRHEATCLTVSAQTQVGDETHQLGMQRCRQGTRLRMDGENVDRLADIARALPIIALHPDSHLLIDGSPDERRRYMDWALFHADPGFHTHWQAYQKALRQRNAALKHARQDPTPWERQLALHGEHITALRRNFVEEIRQLLDDQTQRLRIAHTLHIELSPGWNRELTLEEALQRSRERDRLQGFTAAGPHRADLRLRAGNQLAAHIISRGQQKDLVAVLKLCQARFLTHRGRHSPVVLIDDLPSELDETRRRALLDDLHGQGLQMLVTCIDARDLPERDIPLRDFHVEGGSVRQLV